MKKQTAQQLSSPSFMQMSVADLLATYTETIPVFFSNKMSCVGCSMAAFETLADAARIYGLPADQFRLELITSITQSSQAKSSV